MVKKDFTLKEFKQRWNGPVNEIWAFLIDHGSVEEMKFGKNLQKKFFQLSLKKLSTNFMRNKMQLIVSKNVYGVERATPFAQRRKFSPRSLGIKPTPRSNRANKKLGYNLTTEREKI